MGREDVAARGPRTRPRGLGLTGAPNARDIGGYPVADGRRVATGRVYRADALGRLTDDDVTTLAGLELVTVVDLRGPHEIDQLGEDRLPDRATGVQLPILDPATDVYRLMAELIASRDQERQRARLGDGGGEKFMTDMYRWFVADPGARERFGRLLRQLGRPESVPLLYHCTAGKDRTGWATAVLLSVLGVDRDTVFADYLASNDFNRANGAAMLRNLRTSHLMAEPELLQPLIEVRSGYLATAFAEADRRYGSFDAFVTDGLGLTDGIRERLATALLT